MKRTLNFLIAGIFTIAVQAQTEGQPDNIDWQEDSTEIMSIKDIINEQQQVTTHNRLESHFSNVWSRKSYINLGISTTTLSPEEEISAGYGKENLDDLKNKWAISFQSGRSYRLHPVPIANTIQFYLDYTWIDLTLNSFGSENSGKYNSLEHPDGEEDKYMMPWNLKKYEASYTMSLGPSASICPFNYIDVPLLHYMQLHFYYHIGYQLSGILMSNDEDADVNTDNSSSGDGKRHKQMKDNLKGMWGHGLANSVGFAVSWKGIGIGYERTSSKLKYTPLSTGDFGKEENEFKATRNRVFIQFRM
jgi:hypothetical protein